MRRSRSVLYVTLPAAMFAVLSTGCAGPDAQGPAGAEYPGTPTAIDEAPIVQVGVVDGDSLLQFDRVAAPFRTDDGTLYVPVRGAQAIRIFNASGQYVETLGGSGGGPGEFNGLQAAWPRGDTIEAYDARLVRVTRFFPDGSFEIVSVEPTAPPPVAIGPTPDGWLLYSIGAPAGRGADIMMVHRYGRDGSNLGEIMRLSGMRRFQFEAGSGIEPFSPRSVFAVGGGRFYGGHTDDRVLRRIDTATGEADSVELALPQATETDPAALHARLATLVAARGESRLGEEWLNQFIRAAPAPDRLSEFWDLRIDELGFLWVLPYDPEAHAFAPGQAPDALTGREWLVFTADGAPAGRVATPPGFEPVQIRADEIVGIARDALGVEYVQVHRLERL